MPTLRIFAIDFGVNLVVTIAVAMIATRLLLPRRYGLSLWEALVMQALVFLLALLPAFLIGWLLAYHLTIAFVLLVIVVWWLQRVVIGAVYKAKNGTISEGKKWLIATILVAAAYLVASPLASWLSGDW